MKWYFVVFKKQPGDIKHPYSLVTEKMLLDIPEDIIFTKKEVNDRMYTTEELDTMRDEMV